ncbi:MAG: mechanosensitive ion channel family protein [Lachnospiraceae bacterium]|jgi:small-conductance mechanosensitive channel
MNLEDLAEIVKAIKLPQLIVSLGIIVAAIIFLILFNRFVKRYVNTNSKSDDPNKKTMANSILLSIGKMIFICLVIMMVLDVNGIKISTLLAGLGIGAATIALATQDLLKDLIMGSRILNDNFYTIGDVVSYNNDEYQVISFNLKTTQMKSIGNGNILSVCNRNITQMVKVSDQINIELPLPYDIPLEEAEDVLQKIAETASGNELIDSCEFAGIQRFDSGSIAYLFFVHASPLNKGPAKRAFNKTAQKLLAEAGIDIPFDQLDVHIG